jgi:excisionase family DNA binding protein
MDTPTKSQVIADVVLLRIAELVELTGYSRSFLAGEIRRGHLPVVRRGRTVRIRMIDVERWIGARRVPPRTEADC